MLLPTLLLSLNWEVFSAGKVWKSFTIIWLWSQYAESPQHGYCHLQGLNKAAAGPLVLLGPVLKLSSVIADLLKRQFSGALLLTCFAEFDVILPLIQQITHGHLKPISSFLSFFKLVWTCGITRLKLFPNSKLNPNSKQVSSIVWLVVYCCMMFSCLVTAKIE